MGLAKCASPSSIQPKEHTRGGIQQIPALQLEHFQNLIHEHWILKRKPKQNQTQPYTLVCHGVSAAAYN